MLTYLPSLLMLVAAFLVLTCCAAPVFQQSVEKEQQDKGKKSELDKDPELP